MSNGVREISLEEMRRRLMRVMMPLGTESVGLLAARGRVLAEMLRASAPFPPFDKTAMDGFAVHAADLSAATPESPASLRIVGTIPAGEYSRRRIKRGETARIMTGAPLPPGANAVVRVEDTIEENDVVIISRIAQAGENIIRRGSEMKTGQTVLRRGSPIGPSQMAMLALMDCSKVVVYRKPRVGVLTTGDELGEVGRKRSPGHIPDSNRYALIGLVESAGCLPIDGGRCRDNPDALRAALSRLAKRCDFIITSGGVSAGDFDVVKVLFRRIGGVGLYRLPIKPGKPQAFGKVSGIPYFGLPGNPVSCMIVFEVLLRPALQKIAGMINAPVAGFAAIAGADFPRKSRQWEFPRVHADLKEEEWLVIPVRSQRSSDLTSMTDATGYAVLHPTEQAPKAGERVWYVPFPA